MGSWSPGWRVQSSRCCRWRLSLQPMRLTKSQRSMSGSGRSKLLSVVLWKASHRLCFKCTPCFCMEHSNSLPGPSSTFINIVVHPLFFVQYWQGPQCGLFGTSSTDKGRATTWRIDDHSAESAAEPRCFCPNLCSGSYWHKSSTSSWYDSKQSVLPASLNAVWNCWSFGQCPSGTLGGGHSLPQIPSFSLCWNICHCQCWWELVWVCKNNFARNFARWRGDQWNLLGSSILVWYNIHANPQKPPPLRGQFCSCRCLCLLCGCHNHHPRSSLEAFWGAATASRKFKGLWENSLGMCS